MRSYPIGDSRALGWNDKEDQFLRFEILAGIARDLNNRSVLDAGSGYADLYGFLKIKYPHCRYFGIEQIPEFVSKAIDTFINDQVPVFLQGNFSTAELPNVDYILASGSLNYVNTNPLFLFQTIQKMFAGARLGFGFNLLSKVQEEKSFLCGYDKHMVLSFCKMITPYCVLIDNYLENDFTIFMYHSDTQR